MSRMMQELYRASRHARKPRDQRRRLEVGTAELAAIHASGKTPIVYIDGKRIDYVTVADEIKGEVTFVPQPITLMPGQQDVVRKTLRGTVGIEMEPRV